jgi:hypothetical protein
VELELAQLLRKHFAVELDLDVYAYELERSDD